MSSLYLPVKASGCSSPAICPRCQLKVYTSEMKKDPNTGNYYCKDCVDVLDPYRLPVSAPERITINHPRPDEVLE